MLHDNRGNIINITIVNTGGTFNKVYNELKGTLEVSEKNNFINDILKKAKLSEVDVKGILYKDSLDITTTDRENLLQLVNTISTDKILLVHGTDTMDKTAEFLADKSDKTIVLTGAMQPYSIDPVEATANFMLGFGYLLHCNEKEIYIAMHGLVEKYTNIKKNKQKGIFECLK